MALFKVMMIQYCLIEEADDSFDALEKAEQRLKDYGVDTSGKYFLSIEKQPHEVQLEILPSTDEVVQCHTTH